jgi:hypothetical protein
MPGLVAAMAFRPFASLLNHPQEISCLFQGNTWFISGIWIISALYSLQAFYKGADDRGG